MGQQERHPGPRAQRSSGGLAAALKKAPEGPKTHPPAEV